MVLYYGNLGKVRQPLFINLVDLTRHSTCLEDLLFSRNYWLRGCVSYLSEAVKKEQEGKLNQVVQHLSEKEKFMLSTIKL